MCRLIREVWLHLVVVKCCLVVQQGRNCGQFSSQMLEKLDEYAVWHILTSYHIAVQSNVPFYVYCTLYIIQNVSFVNCSNVMYNLSTLRCVVFSVEFVIRSGI